MLPPDNNYQRSYANIKNVFKSSGMGYETFHECKYGCVLYYKEHAHCKQMEMHGKISVSNFSSSQMRLERCDLD